MSAEHTERPKALIVDPSGVSRTVLRTMVEEAGMQAHLASTGEEALALAQEGGLDLGLLGYQLPDMTGVHLARALRAHIPKGVPLLLLTSEERHECVQDAFRAGITDVFQRTRLAELAAYLHDFANRFSSQELAGERILLVEDSRAYVHVVTEMLQRCGMTVEAAGSVGEARRLIAEHTYHLVITDLALEGEESGLGLVRHLRQHGYGYMKLPILAMTAYDDPTRKTELFLAGVNDYVPKPLVEAEFLARVRNLLIARKLFERVEAQESQMRRLATTDQLTALGNRHLLFELGSRYLARAEREKESLCLLIADIDHFKQVNDRHGHAMGDEVLRAVADVLRLSSRKMDLVARFGGEEFVYLLPHCSPQDALAKAEALRQGCEAMRVGGIGVTISIGVACFDPRQPESLEALFERADQALYEAKRLGRNRVVLHSSEQAATQAGEGQPPAG